MPIASVTTGNPVRSSDSQGVLQDCLDFVSVMYQTGGKTPAVYRDIYRTAQ